VLDGLLGNLHLQPNPAFRQLFDLRLHSKPLCQNCVGVPDMARVAITVSPGAARTELVGRHGDGWRARIAAPPERGRANRALVGLVAELAGVPRDRVVVVAGAGSRRKVLEVEGLDGDELDRRLAAAAGQSS